MQQSTITTPASAQAEQIIKQVLKTWEVQNKNVTDLFAKYDNAFYLSEVAPGRNRAIYILGHLTGMNDYLLPMLGLGEKLFPQLESIFVTAPDDTNAVLPAIETLKEYWNTLNQTLTGHFQTMETADWLSRHTKVSEADFALDPSRNKLNVLMGRINHEAYHIGQLALLNPRKLI